MNPGRRSAAAALVAEAVRARGVARFRALGISMRPLVRAGDVLEVRPAVAGSLRIGDVAVFARAGGLFAHRVIGRVTRGGQPLLITKGDAFPEPDAPVTPRELLGRVALILRGTRRISLDAPRGRVLGRLAAGVSAAAPWWYPGARACKRLLWRLG